MDMKNIKETTQEKHLKINLELHFPGDGRCFLNHWDENGNDTVAEIHRYGVIRCSKDYMLLNQFIEKIKQKFYD